MGPWLILLALLAVQEATEREAVAAAQGFVVVVNTDHDGTAIRREELEKIFLRKAVRWGDGRPIDPVDQSLSSAVRAAFSRRVLQLEPGAVLQYWQAQLQQRSGERPPPVKKSDAEVVEWVGGQVGRIGYVSPGFALAGNVKTVSLVE
jgi:ABC-type phosphate transport system substrate-binding protein